MLVMVEEWGDGVVGLTLNRPEKLNALNLALVQALGAALDGLELRGDVRAVVLTGAGEKAFVAGADVAELKARGAREALAGINARLFRRVESFPATVIAAIRGFALGGGCELALACDLRVGGPSAVFGQPEADLGILPAAGATWRLPRIVGLGRAKELILLGERIGAEEAHRIGLLNRLVGSDEEVMGEAVRLARRAAQRSPMAVRLAKLALQVGQGVDVDTAMAFESAAQAVCFESDDKHQRMERFLSRKP
jgi:enoyl-CoA hydratase